MPTTEKMAKPRAKALGCMLIGWSLALLFGCSKVVEKSEDIRPVRVLRLSTHEIGLASGFSGEVRPRVESRLGFRVGGKIISRKVDVGSPVSQGQILMQLDPLDFQLAQAQANAALRAAESNRDLTVVELKRYQDLRGRNFVSQAVLDAKESANKAAQASVDQALAAFKWQSNQAAYTSLVSNIDGVVTAIDAEVGQVVAPATPVVRVAQTTQLEVAIGIPEDKVDPLRGITDVQVRLWANPNHAIPGKIREISPVADPATRTYLAKVSMPTVPAGVKLGMTAFVQFSATRPSAMIKVPLTALFQEKGVTSVWIVENDTVRLTEVQLGGPAGNDILLVSGVTPGQVVVTAGVNLLKPRQKVKILNGDISQNADGKGRVAAILKPTGTLESAATVAPSAGAEK